MNCRKRSCCRCTQKLGGHYLSPPLRPTDWVSDLTWPPGGNQRANGHHEEDLPDLNCAEVADATAKIQGAFRCHQARKKVIQIRAVKAIEAGLPDLNDAGVQDATVKIQSAFRGFQTRKQTDDLRRLTMAAVRIQKNYRGFR